MAETLEQAFALEEERAVRDQFRDRALTELVEIPVVIERRLELDPPNLWQERVLAAVLAPPRPARPDRTADIARLVLILLVIAAALALVLAGQVQP